MVMSSVVLAQTGALGTKKNVSTSPIDTSPSASALPGMQLLQMLVAIGIVVVVLKFILPKFIAKANRRLQPTLGSSISIEESATFAGGNLVVVKARSKTLLLCVSPQAVTCLADLTEPVTAPEGRAFFEVLDDAGIAPDAAAVRMPQTAAEGSINADDIQGALDRLARLGG